jgi:hypothetical protein
MGNGVVRKGRKTLGISNPNIYILATKPITSKHGLRRKEELQSLIPPSYGSFLWLLQAQVDYQWARL